MSESSKSSNLTSLLANDHLTNDFAKLSHRIDTAMYYMSVEEIVEKLTGEGYEAMDIHFALAAAKILHGDSV